ncbi:MAG: low-specificity L-threonine aldolase [Paracoccaceae bacterium]
MNQYAGATRADRGNAVIADLRSDTLTQPDAGMRQAMYSAELGDDVYGEDPQINRLEQTLADRLGKEAGLFLPTGTMSNLTALLAHCARGEEILVGRGYHIQKYEAAGASVLGGIALEPLELASDGLPDPDTVTAAVKEDDSHLAVTRLLSLENTHNGAAIPLERMASAVEVARAQGLNVHLDGARFFNAITELGCSAPDLAEMADTVSVCLSKGLGTPAGSVLTGPDDLIARARRWRKMLGGGMRQAGVLAAAGLFALDNNVTRLAQDHDRAAALAADLRDMNAGDVRQSTNMIFLTPRDGLNLALQAHMADAGITMSAGPAGPIRFVMHKDIDDTGFETARAAFNSFFS